MSQGAKWLISALIIGVLFLPIFIYPLLSPYDKPSTVVTEKDQNCWIWFDKDKPLQVKLRVEDGYQWVVTSVQDTDQVHVTKMERVMPVKHGGTGFEQYDICYVTGFRSKNRTFVNFALLNKDGEVIKTHHIVVMVR